MRVVMKCRTRYTAYKRLLARIETCSPILSKQCYSVLLQFNKIINYYILRLNASASKMITTSDFKYKRNKTELLKHNFE